MKFKSNKIRIEILLPLTYNDGRTIEKSKFLETSDELAIKFGGCTAMTPAEGLWMDKDSTRMSDTNSGFYVVTLHTEEVLSFLKDYEETLKERFEQREIFITIRN